MASNEMCHTAIAELRSTVGSVTDSRARGPRFDTRSAPILINTLCLYFQKYCYMNLHEFLLASSDDVAL